ncbi:phosphate acetyltransferase [Acetilactobacillus jinshanensis]|uniref:Phosphate acetyltransferase n=1 Tax=Acetilactobacillus jinshanensis TaxID=1720083 RepID=A0A4P6ZLQ8_9LACO|nr:phosphate acetyltransferase [Acetilactobacillus jinshanensis]QBP18795.1 phosphate acetyltransferase [Acetilactobacillus jinshanensis]URL61666.1 phosphate acetyltransferase [uncultured bacterium]
MNLLDQLKTEVKGHHQKIVFPEGGDFRVLEAAAKLANDQVVEPVLLGSADKIKDLANQNGLNLNHVKIIDIKKYPKADYDKMLNALVARRHGKTTREQAKQWLQDPNYFGTMLVYMRLVDGMVSGAIHPTADTVRPALQIIKTKPGVKRVSGAFLMVKGDHRYVFADCAINLTLDADAMSEVAVESAKTAKLFGIDPKVAMLSFSTKGSAKGPMVTSVQQATQLARQKDPKLAIDGELQLDAALVPEVAELKAPGSKVAGHANVLIFPELQSGNIGYKLVQRLGGYEALGPILQGLKYPVSDLSRGCSASDIYRIAIINALQSIK